MRRFTVYRQAPPDTYAGQGHANQPDQPQFEGIVFTDGTVCVRWMTAYRSHSIWPSLQDLMAVHGHPEYGTRVEWHDGTPDQAAADDEPCCHACNQAGKPGERQLQMFGPFVPVDVDAGTATLETLYRRRDQRGR